MPSHFPQRPLQSSRTDRTVPATRVFLITFEETDEETTLPSLSSFKKAYETALADVAESIGMNNRSTELPPHPAPANQTPLPPAAESSEPVASPCSEPIEATRHQNHDRPASLKVRPGSKGSSKQRVRSAESKKKTEQADSQESQTSEPTKAKAPARRVRVRRDLSVFEDDGSSSVTS
jgi:hypothetical protein